MHGLKGTTVALAAAVVLACGGVASGSDTSDIVRETTGSLRLENAGFAGVGTTVAVIDSGVADVPGLHGALIHQQNFSAAPDSGDQYGHGTFVAGLVHRAAPGAAIVSVKLSGSDGSVDVTQVLAALQWVVAHKEQYSIDVVNLSFGNDSKQSWQVSPLNFAVQKAWDSGIVVVTSAGNLGDDAGTVTKPGDDPLVITVGASDDHGSSSTDDDTVPMFASRGPTQDGLTKPDLVAPGTHIVSLRAPGSTIDSSYPQARVGSDGFRGSGTSFSAPIVSGIVAQLLSADPTLSPDEVKHALLTTARPLEEIAQSTQGMGSIKGNRAHSALRSGRANAGVGRSNGSGDLDSARGSAHIDLVHTVPGLTGIAEAVLDPVVGNMTAQGLPFDQGGFLAPEGWSASQWGASQWGASQWGASQWGASQWGASQWWASQWG